MISSGARMPGWRNGRRDGLKNRCPQGRAGSSPAPGTGGSATRFARASHPCREAPAEGRRAGSPAGPEPSLALGLSPAPEATAEGRGAGLPAGLTPSRVLETARAIETREATTAASGRRGADLPAPGETTRQRPRGPSIAGNLSDSLNPQVTEFSLLFQPIRASMKMAEPGSATPGSPSQGCNRRLYSRADRSMLLHGSP